MKPAPPPPPPPPVRTIFLADPLVRMFGVPEGRSLAAILKCKPPFNAYTNTEQMLLHEKDKVDWAIQCLLMLHRAIQGHLDLSRRLEGIRKYFCSNRLRVGQVVETHDMCEWLESLSLAESQNELQAELHSVLARRNSISNDEIFGH